MTDWENFSGNREFAPGMFAGSAEPALHLSGFKNGLLQFRMIAAERIQFVPEELNTVFAIGSDSNPRMSSQCTVCVLGRQRQVTARRAMREVQYFFG